MEGDYTLVQELQDVLSHPYEEQSQEIEGQDCLKTSCLGDRAVVRGLNNIPMVLRIDWSVSGIRLISLLGIVRRKRKGNQYIDATNRSSDYSPDDIWTFNCDINLPNIPAEDVSRPPQGNRRHRHPFPRDYHYFRGEYVLRLLLWGEN